MSYVKERLGTLTGTTLAIIMIVAIIVSIMVSISIGTVNIPISDVYSVLWNKLLDTFGLEADSAFLSGPTYNIVWTLRTPRAFMAAVIGAVLALAGVVMQATVQNPLADPYILGMSSGGTFGAVFAIACGFTGIFSGLMGDLALAFWAFLGSMTSAIAVLTLSAAGGRTTSVKLVLSGTIISSLFGAFSNLIIVLFADENDIQDITYWTLGSLANSQWYEIMIPFVILVVCLIYFYTQIRNLNIMLTGDETATALGIDLSKKRKIYVLLCSLLTASAVCFCGLIGFVGLMIPHIVRSITGNNHWKLVPISVLTGALFMIWADVISRVVLENSELPIGIITAVCGVPIFAYIMIKKSYTFS